MRSIIIVSIVLLVAVIVFTGYWFVSRKSRVHRMGFLDYVRNPDAAASVDSELAERDAVVTRLAQQPCEDLVAMLLDDADPFGLPSRAIEEAGPRVVPALLTAVNDPRFRGGNQTSAFGHIFGVTVEPLEGVLRCLEEFAPPEAVPVVLPLISDKSDDIRKNVAALLASIATDEAAAPVCQLLTDEDDYVRSYAMRGIRRATEGGRASDGFRRAVFDAVLPLVYRRAVSGSDRAPRCLLSLDRDRAIAILTDNKRLAPGQVNLDNVLEALREANVKVDEAPLLEILTALEARATEYPEDSVVGETLRMLATIDSESSREAIDRGLRHASQRVRESAAEAKAIAIGLDEPLKAAWQRRESAGWEGLSTAQKHALAVRILIDEVNNGGFLQYFVNSSGDHWRDAADGLTAIGAEGDRTLFDEALKLFGSEQPGEDGYKRHQQVAAIAKSSDRPFESIEKAFYEDKDDREVRLLIYVLKNIDDFRKKSPSPEAER
jgi:HEAT repeat protein